VPELLLEVASAVGKRRRVGVAAASMRLVDTVASDQWAFQQGLPQTWSQAASSSAPRPSKDPSWQPSPKFLGQEATFREAARRVVVGCSGEAVHLVDVELRSKPTGAKLVAPAAAVGLMSGFLIDGQPMFATSTGEAAPPEHADDDSDDGDFVWDVYAPSETSTGWSCEGFSAYVELNAPIFGEEEWEEVNDDDVGDIDDSSSDGSEHGWVRPGQPRLADNSSDDEQGWDVASERPGPESAWVDSMD